MNKNESMNVTANGVAIALAVVIALGFLFFGQSLFAPFQSNTAIVSEQEATTSPQMGADSKPNSLMITDTVQGTGAEAVPGKKITVNYVGMLENGTVFDASANHGQPFTFTLGVGQVIQGWDQGFAGMKVGGKRHLVIPPDMGYGAQANGPIPANSTLIFDVELLNVQ